MPRSADGCSRETGTRSEPPHRVSEVIAELGLMFPVGHSADARALSAATGAFVDLMRSNLESTGFVLDPSATLCSVCTPVERSADLFPTMSSDWFGGWLDNRHDRDNRQIDGSRHPRATTRCVHQAICVSGRMEARWLVQLRRSCRDRGLRPPATVRRSVPRTWVRPPSTPGHGRRPRRGSR
jgi:hypothetical protein